MHETDGTSPYSIVRVLKEVTIGADRNIPSTLSVLVQRRRRDDGKMSREFVSIKFDVGKKVFFFSVPSAEDLLNGLGSVLPEAKAEEDRMRQDWEARRERWESRSQSVSEHPAPAIFEDLSGKRKLERSERHRDSRHKSRNDEE